MRFRDDILRGVRLFLIVFAAILVGVWAYRLLRAPSDVQGAAQQEVPAQPDVAQPAPAPPASAAPVAEASTDSHGLVVPPPPPVAGVQAKPVAATKPGKGSRLKDRDSVPPPPPPVAAKARRAPAPSGREFETSQPGLTPAAPSVVSADTTQAAPTNAVGYKSLLEVDPNRPAIEPVAQAAEEPPAAKPKGNRFFRAVGKIFRPGAKKETAPLTLEQPKP